MKNEDVASTWLAFKSLKSGAQRLQRDYTIISIFCQVFAMNIKKEDVGLKPPNYILANGFGTSSFMMIKYQKIAN